MIVEEVTYLEHYGKKGMKWGTRTATKVSAPAVRVGGRIGRAIKGQSSPKEKKQNRKILIRTAQVASVAAVTAGAIYMKKRTNITKVPYNKLPTKSPAHQKFVSDFMKKQFRLNAKANTDLKTLYDMNSTPIHMRDYLPILPGQKFGPRSDG